MGGIASVLYGTVVYVFFLGTFTYAILFVGNILVPRTVDGPPRTDVLEAVLINLALLTVFALQHSVMARKGFKKWWTQFVPPAVERSTYVLAASAALAALVWYWQPIEGTVWRIDNPVGVALVWIIFATGWGILLLATFLINHFELFGLRQVFARLTGKKIPEGEFRTPMLYKYVRHPIYLGFIMGFWAAPHMTYGHLLFAAAATGYILVGIWFEERDLIATFGDRYRAYKQQVGMLFPKFKSRGGTAVR
jgi:methanethiol S-methyltransferase